MHAIKGGWVGQTFAMATSSDSGGKKARIRRSKEERKALVESFIKRYQKSNNGKFPSINLTHKEVGGSYYIVREIVREIIQDNRVLSPASVSAEDQSDPEFLEQYPLGSISTEPRIQILSSEETQVTILDSSGKFYEHEHQTVKDELVVNNNPTAFGNDQASDGSSTTLSSPTDDESTNQEQFSSSSEKIPETMTEQFVNDETINGYETNLQGVSSELIPSDAIPIHDELTSVAQLQHEVKRSISEEVDNGISQQSLKYEECKEKAHAEPLVQESLGTKKEEEKEQKSLEAGVTQITTDVVVETFPLRPVSKIINGLDERSGESIEISSPLKVKSTDEDGSNSLKSASVSKDEEGQATEDFLKLEINKAIMDGKEVLATNSESTSGSLTKRDIMPDNGSSSPAGTKPVNSPNGIHLENLNITSTGGSPMQSIPVKTTSYTNGLDVQHDSSPKKGSSPTLDRINLETWEGRSSKSAGSETNPLLAYFKAFLTAFVKFWTE